MTLDITVTDMFCGAGGSTTGAVRAGALVQLAINHWPVALETHNTNYPQTTHVLTDISSTDPRRYPDTTILIASPECVNHSLAKGQKRRRLAQLPLAGFGEKGYDPAEERSRCTMWDPLRWAECHKYELVILENVVDARLWVMWEAWLHAWQNLGYSWEVVYLNSMFAHPTPQSRDRMYFIAWRHGNRKPDLKIAPLAYCQKCDRNVEAVQSWKNPQRRWGKYKQQYMYCCPHCASIVTPYYYAAANAIDWSQPVQRIGDREKPLREKTMQRIRYGLEKFTGHPFSIPMTRIQDRLRNIVEEPFPTQTATETQALVMPFLINLSHSQSRQGYVYGTDEGPLPTQTTRDDVALILPFIAELHGTSIARSITDALATVCAGGLHHGLVLPLPFLLDHLGEYRPRSLTGPLSTIVGEGNHQSVIIPPSWLMTYYNNGQLAPVEEAVPTVTTLERHALVTASSPCARGAIRIEDCGFRMLGWEEIRAAMAFPADYVLAGNRREKVRQLGNAVTPPVMEILMQRGIVSLQE